MTVTDKMVLAGAKALHEEWRASILPGGTNHSMRPIIKDETLFSWENLHPENRDSYLRTSRTALTAALSDQAGEKELTLVRSQLSECHKEIFKLREALIAAPLPSSTAGEVG